MARNNINESFFYLHNINLRALARGKELRRNHSRTEERMEYYFVKRLQYYRNCTTSSCFGFSEKPIPYYDLTFVFKGQLTYTADGETLVLNPGDVMLLPPGTLRSRAYTDKPVKYACFNFTLLPNVTLPLERVTHDAVSEDMKKLIAAFPQSRLSPYYHSREKAANLLNYILFELLEASELKTNNPYVVKILKYVEEHIKEKMSLQSISRVLGITKEYASSLFKKETGKTITAFVNERKMHFAKETILSHEMSLTKLSAYLGYDNYHYFSRLFKRYFKVTPRDLQNRK